MERLLAVAALLFTATANSSDMALVVTNGERPERCLSAVVIRELDGEDVTVSHRAFELAPGRHTMNGMANINTRFCPVPGDGRGAGIPDLTADFEAGKTYYVGLEHASPDREDWQLVVWRIEQDGVQLFSLEGSEEGPVDSE